MMATSLGNLANLYKNQKRYSEAEKLFKETLKLDKKLLGEEHSMMATSLGNLANLYKDQGRFSEAEPLYEEALKILERAFGNQHMKTKTIRKELKRVKKKIPKSKTKR